MIESKRTRRDIIAGGAFAAGAGFLSRRARAAGSGPIRIGVLTDMSGPYVDSGGRGSVLAAKMAADEVGTVLGQPVEILQGDTQNKPDIAAAIARQWCDSGIDAIVDLPVTSVAAAVQAVAREKNTTVMITAGAASEFTSKSCSLNSTHWADDTHALAGSATAEIVRTGGKSWYFITVDYAFGSALQREATDVIQKNGGRVVGSVRFPIGTADFSSLILQAQASGAQVIGLAAVGNDLVNLVKQAGEFGVVRGGAQRLAGFLIYITEVNALGLDVAQGFTFGSGFYWDQNEVARAWSTRFFERQHAMPTRVHGATFTSTRHFLRAMQRAGQRDTAAVNRTMRAMPVDYLGKPATVREDGRVLFDLGVYRVKSPGQSRGAWDYYEQIGTVPAADSFLPPNAACTA
jgi:branched-chain amino acid transport system substrate-binding protein